MRWSTSCRHCALLAFWVLSVLTSGPSMAQSDSASGSGRKAESGAMDEASPASSSAERALPPDLADRAGADRTLGELTQAGNVQELETLFSDARAQRAEMADGELRISYYYRSIMDSIPGKDDDFAAWSRQVEALVEEWKRAFPASPSPWIIHAGLEVRRAWHIRGNDVAANVDPAAWPSFEQHLHIAEQALVRAEAMTPRDVHVYAGWLSVAMGLSYEPVRLREVFENGMALDPMYFELHQRMAINLLPRWGGAPGEVERLAADVADRIGGEEGDMQYARIARYDYRYVGAAEFGLERRYDWARVRRGYRLLQERYPTIPRFLAQEVQIAAAVGDAAAASEALSRFTPAWREFYFDDQSDARIMDIYGARADLLRQAARDGNTATVTAMLDAGVSVHAADEAGFSPAAYAIAGGNSEVLESLILRGADPNTFRPGGTSLLYQAVGNNDPACVRVLLRHGANPDGDARDEAPLQTGIWHGYEETVRVLLDGGADREKWDPKLDAPLPQAVSRGQVGIARELLIRGANPNRVWTVNEADPREASWTPLHTAIARKDVAMVRLLLKYGADPQIETAKLGTPSEYAATHGSPEMIEAFREQGVSEIEVSPAKLSDPLFAAVNSKNHARATQLLEMGADPNAKNANGWTVLHAALQAVDAGMVELLLKNGADGNVKLDGRWTPLALAMSKQLDAAVRGLIESGADPSSRTFDRTPLYHAAEVGNVEWARLFVEAGADASERSGPQQAAPLTVAASHGHADVVEYLASLPGVDVDAVDHTKATALHAAARGGHRRAVEVLLRQGADASLKERAGVTPAVSAKLRGHGEIAVLIENHLREHPAASREE
jgi:ankyrin repeat protein